MDLISLSVPLFILSILLEWVWGLVKKQNTYRLNDTYSSLILGLLSRAQKLVMLGVGGVVYAWIAAHFSLEQLSADAWWVWVFAFVLYDLCYYWLHRMGHERQILWAAHVAHHQSEEYNLSTALRQTSTGFIFGWIFYIPMFLFGVPAEVVVTVGALNLIYQFWVHTRHVPELGWFEWVFVSPSNHRVHHAQNDCYLDKNYGGVFIVWDRLFGTYQRELPEEPCIYGIRGPIHSWNPVVALTHIYRDMWLDMLHTRGVWSKLRVLTARTGWQPEDIAPEYRRQKSDLSKFEVYDTSVSWPAQGIAVVQLLVAVSLLAFSVLVPMTHEEKWVLVSLMLWAGVSGAYWLEGRTHWALVWSDKVRAVLLVWLAAPYSPAWLYLSATFGVATIALIWLALRQKNTRGADSAAGISEEVA